jgi:virginiamycin B lyase
MSSVFFSRRNVVLIVATLFVLIAAALSLRMRNGHGTGGDFVEYQMIVANDIPTTVAVAPDNTVWFTIGFADAIGMIRNGKLQRLPKGKKSVEPTGLGVDADGAAWFTDPTEVLISRILPSGDIKSFPLGTPIARLGRLAVAPDGAVWFAESTTYGFTRLKDGVLTRNVPRSVRGGPYGVAVDTRGDVWGTLQSGNQLVKISQGKEIAEYEIPTPGSSPSDVAADNAGNIWVLEFRSNKIAKFSSGKFLEFVVPGEWSGLSGIAAAADGSVWFGLLRNHSIGRLRNGEFKIFQLPRKDARPYTLAIDKDSNVWYADISGYVGMLKADAASR